MAIETFEKSPRPTQGLLALAKAAVTVEEAAELLDASPWATEFSFAQVKKLAASMEVYEVPAGTVLFREGDREPYFILVIKGQVHVAKFDAAGKARRLATLGAGKTLGDMALIDGEPRSAAAVTHGPVKLMVMTGERFDQLVESSPAVAVLLLSKIAKLMSQHLRQTSGRLLENLNSSQ